MEARISRSLLDRLLAEAAASPALEICGLLLGRVDGTDCAIDGAPAAANVASHPADSFELDPAALLAAHRAGRTGGPHLLGHYHSHPQGPASPSPRDAAAAEPGRLWLILGDDGARLWLAQPAAAFVEVPLTVA